MVHNPQTGLDRAIASQKWPTSTPPYHLWESLIECESTSKETGACRWPVTDGFPKNSVLVLLCSMQSGGHHQMMSCLQSIALPSSISFHLTPLGRDGVCIANFREVDNHCWTFFWRFSIVWCYLSMHSPTLLLSLERDTVTNWHWCDLWVELDEHNVQEMSRPWNNR